MAYLSNVTHDKLVGKYTPSAEGFGGQHMTIAYGGEEIVEPVDIGLKNCGSFEANVRCCASFETGGSIRNLHCWTGESDGTITVRQAWTGETITVLDKKQGVFVSCLKFINGTMYAGMSDGCLRAYRINASETEMEYMLVAEAKKHLGEITCIENVGENAVTGARDWQVYVWRWEAGQLKVCDQWLGHKLPVRSLTYSDGYLYTGGDDSWVRCVSMSTGMEKISAEGTNGFPVKVRGSARALCAFGPVLFCGDDETLNVYDSVNGEHLALLLESEGAVLTLMRDPAGRRVWSGGVDGVVRLWDADPRSGFKMLTAINDHNGTAVRMLIPLTRVTASKAWTVDRDGRLKLWYSESDCSEFESEQNAEEERLTQSIHDLRMVLNTNAANLDQLKKELEKYEALEKGRKQQIVKVFARAADARILKRHWYKLFHMRERYNQLRKLTSLSLSLQASSHHELRTAYYAALLRFARWSISTRLKKKFAETLLGSTSQTLSLLYWSKLKAHAQQQHRLQRRRELAGAMALLSTNLALRGGFLRWGRWVQDQRQRRKRRGVSHVLFRHTRLGLLFVYYGKLLSFWKQIREAHRKGTLSNSLLCTLHKTVRYAYYAKWYRWYSGRKNKSRRAQVVKILMQSSRQSIYRVYYLKLVEYRTFKMHKRMESEHAAMLATVRKLEEKLEESKQVTESGLKNEVQNLQAESDRLTSDIEALEKEVGDLDAQQSALEKQAMGYQINKDAPLAEQVFSVTSFLKAHGVSCRYDIKDITDASKQHDKGLATFNSGIQQARKVLAAFSKGSDEAWWGMGIGELGTLPDHMRAAAHRGIKAIIIGVDQMRYFKTPFPVKESQAFLDNLPYVYEVVRLTHDKRIGKENSEVEAWENKLVADPYASRHGKLLHTREEIEELANSQRQSFKRTPTSSSLSPAAHASSPALASSGALRGSPHMKAVASFRDSPGMKPLTPPTAALPPPAAESANGNGSSVSRSPSPKRLPAALESALPSTYEASEKAKPRRAAPGFKIANTMAVTDVTSAAAKAAGLQAGDVITAINLQNVGDKPAYVSIVKNVAPDTSVAVSFKRGARTRTVEIKMGAM